MAVDKEAISLSRVYSYESKCTQNGENDRRPDNKETISCHHLCNGRSKVHFATNLIYCITHYFRGRKFSRKLNLRYFREKIFSRIYCSRENIFPRKYLPAKISSRENFPSRKYLPAKITSRELIPCRKYAG